VGRAAARAVASRRTRRCRRAARGRGEEICECGPARGRGGEGSGKVANGLTGLRGSVDWIWTLQWRPCVFWLAFLDRGMLTCPADVVIKQSWVCVF
jgi:hypothetical protein